MAGASWYYLWVDGPADHIFHKWYSSTDANCDGVTCSVAGATPNLGGGTHTWYVQTWNSIGYGPWSDGMSFTPSAPTLPGKASLVSPSGSIGSNNPTYTWNEVSGATYYYLWLDGPSGHVFDKWYTAAQANCNGSTCSVAGATPSLTPGAHTWWIQTWNEGGYGPWSHRMDFGIPLPPETATLVSPDGSIATTAPDYTWNKVANSTWYYLWVSQVNADGSLTTIHNKWYEAPPICSGATCSVTPAGVSLSSGNYRWWIQTWNDGGYGPWSNGKSFLIP